MESIVFIILQIFLATRAVLKLENITQIFPSFRWGILSHPTRLDKSRASLLKDVVSLVNQSTISSVVAYTLG